MRFPQRGILYLAVLCLTVTAEAKRWTLVDFGCDKNSTTFGDYNPTWNQVVIDTAQTRFVNPTGSPELCGITENFSDTKQQTAYCVKGTSPIRFAVGQKIIVTVCNQGRGYIDPLCRISFTDSLPPSDTGSWQRPWYTMYPESEDFSSAANRKKICCVSWSTISPVSRPRPVLSPSPRQVTTRCSA